MLSEFPSYDDLSPEQDDVLRLPLGGIIDPPRGGGDDPPGIEISDPTGGEGDDECNGSYLILGPPGTGKSVMALYRTVQFLKQGKKVVLLTYSRLLNNYMSQLLETCFDIDAEEVVKTYHTWSKFGLWQDLMGGDGNPPHHGDDLYDINWDAILNELGDLEPLPINLIVDEGQDLPKEFYGVARLLFSTVTVFADENQSINKTRNSTIKEIRQWGSFRDECIRYLEYNYRNTEPIANLARSLYPGDTNELPLINPERIGSKPMITGWDSFDDSQEAIANFANNYPNENIGIFFPLSKGNWLTKAWSKALDELIDGREIQTYFRGRGAPPKINFMRPNLILTNYKNAKGLEFDRVFLVELQNNGWPTLGEPHGEHIYYVLVSRARDNLHIHYSGSNRPTIFSSFPNDKIDYDE